MKKISIMLTIIGITGILSAQSKYIEGRVIGTGPQSGETKNLPVIGANIHWEGTTIGTSTNQDGYFKLKYSPSANNKLVVSYVGYKNDTLLIDVDPGFLDIKLVENPEIDEVTVFNRQKGNYLSKATAIQTETVTAAGLQKLPCCNLAESFENTATVDVGFADAVSGAKQIKMLGLAGKYSQILIEKKPAIRGLSSNFGISYIPGTWMDAIQVSKGTSSVIDGYESITGQINVEYKKPDNSDPLHINLYTNNLGRMEANLTSARKLNENWSTLLFFTGGHNGIEHDLNDDNFIDLPLNTQVHVMNRWKYNSNKNYRGQFGFTYFNEDRSGGHISSNEDLTAGSPGSYNIGINTQRFDVYGKNGFHLPNNPNQSIGMITNFAYHDVGSNYGNRNYSAKQGSFYANMIFRTIIRNTNHNLSTGFSFIYDDYQEIFEELDLSREEIVPGIFAEYNYSNGELFNLIAGIRYDRNSLYSDFLTPRLHMKYNISGTTIIRASIGKGYRTANILSENPGIFASSRQIYLLEELKAEEAWNIGANLVHDFAITDEKIMSLSLDFYRTEFINQVVVDMDKDMQSVFFYNLDGRSYSNSYQIGIDVEPFERFEITSAVRYNDVWVTIDEKLREKPFTKKFKALLSLSYATNYYKWSFDVNLQYNGKSRLPEALKQVSTLEYSDFSPAFTMLHAQITKKFRKFSVYLGGENLTGYIQENPIIGADNPFGDNFDASMVWGPIVGRKFFIGLRYTMQ